MGAKLEYVWWPQRKDFVEKSVGTGNCDLLLSVPAAMDDVLVTRPYYDSTYVFVSRADRHLNISSLVDPRLAEYRIGIHVVGDDYAPPGFVLARRGLSANIRSFSLFGKAQDPNPPAHIIEAVRRGDVDVAIVWGPLAGYYAKAPGAALQITPVTPSSFLAVPFTYQVSAAVAWNNESLRSEVDQVLGRECTAIQALLAEYGVPRVTEENSRCESLPSPPVASH